MVCGGGSLSGLHRGVIKFAGLGLEGHPDGSSERNVLKVYSLKREQEQDKLYFMEGLIFQPLREGRS